MNWLFLFAKIPKSCLRHNNRSKEVRFDLCPEFRSRRVFDGRKIAISRIVNDHIQRAKYIDRRHYRVFCCCFVGHIHCEELDLISISFRQIGQRLNVPSCRQHSIASSEARFNNCVTPTTRAAGDYPYLRHSSSSIKPPGYSGESSQTQDWMRDGYTKGLVSYGGNRRIFRSQGDSLRVRESQEG